MAKHMPMPADLNRRAKAIVDLATWDDADRGPLKDPDAAKDRAAVESGRRGGQRGGKARAEKHTPEQRS